MVGLWATPAGAAVLAASASAASDGLTIGQAIVLGVVEGVTEFLPISSTGHLLVTARILDVGTHGRAEDAIKSYEIAIQAGAILAVLGLYRHRFATMVEGVVGRSEAGRKVLIAVAVAFVPAAIVGVVLEKEIKDRLFGPWPVVAAWAVGGVLILVFSRNGVLAPRGGLRVEDITVKHAAIIGAAQVLSLWPGTSRSLVTIVAGLLIGLSMTAAVEFSFLLGFVTLSAATAYQMLKDGQTMIDAFGIAAPLIGLLSAFVAAVLAIRWMVHYLERHDLSIFGWYRLGVAALVAVLVLTGSI